jgi:hypothetical protein
MDVKGGALGLLEALTALLQQGYLPTRTLLVALGHDEEVGGFGAREVACCWVEGRGGAGRGGQGRGGGEGEGGEGQPLPVGHVWRGGQNASREGSVAPGPAHVPPCWCKCARVAHGHELCSASPVYAKSYAVRPLTYGFHIRQAAAAVCPWH